MLGRKLGVAALLGLVATSGLSPAPAFFPEENLVFKVGAAVRDITPTGLTNVGGNGLGDGTLPSQVVGRGAQASPGAEHLGARALVVEADEWFRGPAVVIADIETQGMFAAYKGGGYGLRDIAVAAAAVRPPVGGVGGLDADRMILAADHTHSGPDTIGAWGFVPQDYMQRVKDLAVAAIVEAYDRRVQSTLWSGRALAADLVYNQNCTEALNQDPSPVYPGPSACNLPDQDVKDAWVHVLQARSVATGAVVTTLVSFNAHATLGGAGGLHGDWPQFLSDQLTARYGGTGIAMEGAVGRIQPCRPQCSFTDPAQFGSATDRRGKYLHALGLKVDAALSGASRVVGTVWAERTFVREPITSPTVLALFAGGSAVGAELRRSNSAPWLVGSVIGTPVTSIAIGKVLLSGYPGEAYPNIHVGVGTAVSAAVPGGLIDHIPLGLANDQLGYLIAPAEAWPMVAAEVAVNDNSIFNVSQTIGDHVMCASIANAGRIFRGVVAPPRCVAYGALDSVGGVALGSG
jgi:hypothetical protein